MGIPGFFRWIHQKFKQTSLVTKNIQSINKIDALFFDLNGLIHPQCYAVLESEKKFNTIFELEKEMISKCIEYLDSIVEYIKPQSLLYIAIDGVAPMAKIKQQRYRRYKSVSDKFLFDSIKRKYNMNLSSKWSGSSITPGTIFMDKIRKELMNYCNKLAEKKKFKIIFSGSNTPGEGEHKIFKFIRNNTFKNYMIYGLDADLIFLSIASNKNNIFLLREANQFDKKEEGFNIIKMDIFKYLIIEIFTQEYQSQLKDNYSSKYINTNKLLNDFVCIYFLLGNDFIPHIPSLHIYHNGSDLLIKHYVTVQIKTNNYIMNINNSINNIIIYQLLHQMAINEVDNLNDIRINEKKRGVPRRIDNNYDREMYKINNLIFQYKDPVQIGKENFKQRYYEHYKIDDVTKMVSEYIKSISWIQQYYFNDTPSWTYYYPYHVAPFISDIIQYFNNSVVNYNFKPSKPYYPFEQLSMVLHPYNFYLLPRTIKDYYSMTKDDMHPTRFDIDYLYKTKHFKTIPLLPNINVKFIKDSVYKLKNTFNMNERNRNRHYNECVF